MNPFEERLSALLQSGTPEPPHPVTVEQIRERLTGAGTVGTPASINGAGHVTAAPVRRAPWTLALLPAAAILAVLLAVGVGRQFYPVKQPPQSLPGTTSRAAIGATGPGYLAYVTGGNVWFAGRQLTHDGSDNWPRIQPGGELVVYSHGTQLWVVGTAGNTSPRLLVDTGVVGRPAWSPDGAQLAYIDATAGLALRVADVDNGVLGGARTVAGAGPLPVGGTGWLPMLQRTAAVAWSPDGRTIAHTGGACLASHTSCVSLLDVASGRDEMVVGFGGSGGGATGFANIPAFSADSGTLYLTTQHNDPAHGVSNADPVHVVGCVLATGCDIDHQVLVGQPGDTVASPSPLPDSRLILVTGAHSSQSWVTRLDAEGRSYLVQGYAQDWAG